MSDVAIRVENLSKKFYLGERIGLRTFREALQDALARPLRRIIRGEKNALAADEKVDTDRQIWALKDVSFEVKHGEVLGIIGPNGAGKSTLLKILSRITEPTGGYAEIRGRVGSLLEVGTGFHPELTGRENVFLNGAILGMSKAEIRRKFDDIVAFAGVEKFIDTPVKRYSSGMQVRLAFAVAAHLDPEILIIDEVLAVGDAEFQKRCLGKMNEVSRSGRTVLFVSHNMAALSRICVTGLLIKRGTLITSGPIRASIEMYTRDACSYSPQHGDLLRLPREQGHMPLLKRLVIRTEEGTPRTTLAMGSSVVFEVHTGPMLHLSGVQVGIIITDIFGNWVAISNTRKQPLNTASDVYLCTRHCWHVPQLLLLPGRYHVDLSVAHPKIGRVDYLPKAGVFDVTVGDIYGTGIPFTEHDGAVCLHGCWSCDGADE